MTRPPIVPVGAWAPSRAEHIRPTTSARVKRRTTAIRRSSTGGLGGTRCMGKSRAPKCRRVLWKARNRRVVRPHTTTAWHLNAVGQLNCQEPESEVYHFNRV